MREGLAEEWTGEGVEGVWRWSMQRFREDQQGWRGRVRKQRSGERGQHDQSVVH